MAKENLHGLMVGDIMGNIRMMQNMGLVYLSGQMAKNTKEIGFRENSMVLVNILVQKVVYVKENGMKEDEFVGLKKPRQWRLKKWKMKP